MDGSTPPSRTPGSPGGAGSELCGAAAVRLWFDRLCADYAGDVRWIAPRRALRLVGREFVVRQLRHELACMGRPRVCVMRECGPGAARGFHEYAIRFQLLAPGIAGVPLPIGADVELERLRVLTRDGDGRITAESSIEIWTRLPGAEGPAGV